MIVESARPAVLPGVRMAAWAGIGGVLVSAGLVLVLHLLVPVPGPIYTMISEYALSGYRPVFDLGVLILVASSVAVRAALAGTGAIRPGGAAAWLLLVWCAGMALVVAFPTTPSAEPPTPITIVHAIAAVAGFAALPAAGLLIARAWRADHRRRAVAVRVLSVLSLLLLVPVLGGLAPGSPLAVQAVSGVPFGGMQRVLMAVNLLLLVVLATGALARTSLARTSSPR